MYGRSVGISTRSSLLWCLRRLNANSWSVEPSFIQPDLYHVENKQVCYIGCPSSTSNSTKHCPESVAVNLRCCAGHRRRLPAHLLPDLHSLSQSDGHQVVSTTSANHDLLSNRMAWGRTDSILKLLIIYTINNGTLTFL